MDAIWLYTVYWERVLKNTEINKIIKKICFLFFLLHTCIAQAQNAYRTNKNISHIPGSETDTYRPERRKPDIYYPENKKDSSTIVWFHGGGTEDGNKFVLKELREQGSAVVTVNYRLSPKAENLTYIEGVAEAVVWVFRNIEKYGGCGDHIFVSGHSAGGYLSLILAMDKKYMVAYGADADSVTAYPPVGGQTVTHPTIRKERGLPDGIPVVSEYAPVNKARKETTPLASIMEDKHLEMAARYEENALLEAVLKSIGNKKVTLYEMRGLDYGQVLGPACYLIAGYVERFR